MAIEPYESFTIIPRGHMYEMSKSFKTSGLLTHTIAKTILLTSGYKYCFANRNECMHNFLLACNQQFKNV